MEADNYKPEQEPVAEPDDSIFIDQVVKQIQLEVGAQLFQQPDMSVHHIKIQAMQRFIDLINKGLLSQREADKCYQRFAQMVDLHYGTKH